MESCIARYNLGERNPRLGSATDSVNIFTKGLRLYTIVFLVTDSHQVKPQHDFNSIQVASI